MEMGQFYSFFLCCAKYVFSPKELSELAAYLASICQFDFKPSNSLFVIEFLKKVIYILSTMFFYNWDCRHPVVGVVGRQEDWRPCCCCCLSLLQWWWREEGPTWTTHNPRAVPGLPRHPSWSTAGVWEVLGPLFWIALCDSLCELCW